MVFGLLVVVLVITSAFTCALTRTCMVAREHGWYSNSIRKMHMQKLLRQHVLSSKVAAQVAVAVDHIQAVGTQKVPQAQWKVAPMANINAGGWIVPLESLVEASQP